MLTRSVRCKPNTPDPLDRVRRWFPRDRRKEDRALPSAL